MTIPAALAVERLVVDLDGQPVLHGIDLVVHPGELVALLGANGSGKSTLVRAAVGLIPHREGEVQLFGRPLARFRDHGRLGYVPQRSGSTAGVPATVREVVASGRLARRRWLVRRSAADTEAVDRAIELVGLTTLARRQVDDLSGGERQRVLVARALATEPDLLVMDEPTAGIDQDNQQVLTGLVAELVGAGTAVLLVAHGLGGLRRHVDRAVVLDDGRLVLDTAPDERIDRFVGGLEDHHHDEEPPPSSAVSSAGVWT